MEEFCPCAFSNPLRIFALVFAVLFMTSRVVVSACLPVFVLTFIHTFIYKSPPPSIFLILTEDEIRYPRNVIIVVMSQ